jgi:hypothetical protein
LFEDTYLCFDSFCKIRDDGTAEGIQLLTNDKNYKSLFSDKGRYLVHKMESLPVEEFLIKLCDLLANLITLEDVKLADSFVKGCLKKTATILKYFKEDIVFIDSKDPDLSVLECYRDLELLLSERTALWETRWNKHV